MLLSYSDGSGAFLGTIIFIGIVLALIKGVLEGIFGIDLSIDQQDSPSAPKNSRPPTDNNKNKIIKSVPTQSKASEVSNSTKFKGINITELLKHSIPKRFQDLSPTDFEDFMSKLFYDAGYTVESTPYSGDFGADLIASKNGSKYAIQVKRYAKGNNVGVPDVNQVIGAKDYYKCDKAMIVTTSNYTKPAIDLCGKTNVSRWPWDTLLKNIQNVYLEGKDYYDFFSDNSLNSKENIFVFSVSEIEYNSLMDNKRLYTLVKVKIKNNGPNIQIDIGTPIIITREGKQVEASLWYSGFFKGGTIYSGAEVEMGFLFSTEQISCINNGDRFIFNIQDGTTNEIKTYDITVSIT